MKQEKIKYFLCEDKYYQVPYNKFIKNVVKINEKAYTTKLNRYVFYFDKKMWVCEKQEVLLRFKRKEKDIIFLEMNGE